MANLNTTDFSDITKSVDQIFNHLSLTNVTVPRFDSSKDIFDFIAEFEAATSIVTDENKAKLLLKTFPLDRSKAWFERELKPAIEGNKPWRELRKMLISRFSDLEDRDRHLKKLFNVKYDPRSGQRLLDYVEDYIYTFQKAFGEKFDDNLCVKNLKATLPSEITPTLNLLPSFKSAKSTSEISAAIKDYDQSYRNTDIFNQSNKIDATQMAKIFKELIKKSEMTQSVVASLQAQLDEEKQNRQSRRNSDSSTKGSPHQGRRHERDRTPSDKPYRGNVSPRYRSPVCIWHRERSPVRQYDHKISSSNHRDKSPNYRKSRDQSPVEVNRDRHTQSVKRNIAFDDDLYYKRFGKPENPCDECKGAHHTRHCPINLK